MSKYTPQMKHAPADDSVQVPAAIRAAAARSAALHKEMYDDPAAGQPPAQQETPPAQQETPPPAQQETPPPANADSPPDWEANYKAMKGRFDKANETIGGLNSRIMQLESQLRQPAPAPAPAPQQTPDLRFKPVTPEDRENYGEDFLDVAARAAAEKLVPEIASLRTQLDQLRQSASATAEDVEVRRKREMYAHLNGELPDWRTLNKDVKFIAWLNLPDPFSGVIRRAMMQDAFDKADGPRVARFFQGFLSDEAATGPATTQTEPPNGKVPLETFAAPGRAKAPAAAIVPVPGEKELITHAQIAAFYSDVNKGHYRGNEAEKDRLEKMIFDAQAEGRVV